LACGLAVLLTQEPRIGDTAGPGLPAGAPAGWAVVSYAGKGLPPAPPPGAPGKPGGNPPAPGKPGGKGLARRAQQQAYRLRLALGRAPAHARRQAASGLSCAGPAAAWRCSSMNRAGEVCLHQLHRQRKQIGSSSPPVAKRGDPSKQTGACDSVAPPCTQHSSARPSAGARPGTHDAPPGAPPPLAAWSIICCIACGARARRYGDCSLCPWVCTLSLSLGPRQVDWQTHQEQPPDGHAWSSI